MANPSIDGPPIFVPVALKLSEAKALLAAAFTVYRSLTALGLEAGEERAELARGMADLATAIGKAEL